MQLMQTIEVWREACKKANTEWFLYKETLLCAEGLKEFPNELEYAQVAVRESDALGVLDKICADLDGKWTNNKDSFWEKRKLVFKDGERKVLSVSVIDDDFVGGTLTLCVAGKEYPVFEGYRDYLSQTYGDYENGLHDDIGVGLTVEEKDELRLHQEKCLEALRFLKKVADENGLSYYLLAGSVLGAVRHGGFIPWDDDIDVGIRIEDIKKFENALKNNMSLLPEGFKLQQPKPYRAYMRMFSKICYNGRCCIDLWPLVPTYKDGLKAKLTWYFGKMMTKVHYYKLGKRNMKYLKIARLMSAVLTDRAVMAFARLNERVYAHKNTPAYINLYSIYKRNKETIDREWLDNYETALFGDIEVPIVGSTDEYLTHLYGDYMQFPPPWKRASRHTTLFLTED